MNRKWKLQKSKVEEEKEEEASAMPLNLRQNLKQALLRHRRTLNATADLLSRRLSLCRLWWLFHLLLSNFAIMNLASANTLVHYLALQLFRP